MNSRLLCAVPRRNKQKEPALLRLDRVSLWKPFKMEGYRRAVLLFFFLIVYSFCVFCLPNEVAFSDNGAFDVEELWMTVTKKKSFKYVLVMEKQTNTHAHKSENCRKKCDWDWRKEKRKEKRHIQRVSRKNKTKQSEVEVHEGGATSCLTIIIAIINKRQVCDGRAVWRLVSVGLACTHHWQSHTDTHELQPNAGGWGSWEHHKRKLNLLWRTSYKWEQESKKKVK